MCFLYIYVCVCFYVFKRCILLQQVLYLSRIFSRIVLAVCFQRMIQFFCCILSKDCSSKNMQDTCLSFFLAVVLRIVLPKKCQNMCICLIHGGLLPHILYFPPMYVFQGLIFQKYKETNVFLIVLSLFTSNKYIVFYIVFFHRGLSFQTVTVQEKDSQSLVSKRLLFLVFLDDDFVPTITFLTHCILWVLLLDSSFSIVLTMVVLLNSSCSYFFC